jgi:ABC-type transport system involved in multi-copper enzyme maturation permease subunit
VVLLIGIAHRLVHWTDRTWKNAHLVGPLLTYDLARLARRGRTTMLRCLYGLLLLVWLGIIVVKQFGWSAHPLHLFGPGPNLSMAAWAEFARGFVGAILSLQGAAVMVLTPVYLAGAIAEEKERKTIELLFATDLRDQEIVLGKLFGRLAHLACVLLTGLPILALVRLWGGVDGSVLLTSFAITCLALLSVGSISLLCSVLCRSSLAAVLSSYALVFPLVALGAVAHGIEPVFFMSGYEERMTEEWAEWERAVQGGGPIMISYSRLPPPPVAAFVPPPPDPTRTLLGMLVPAVFLHGVIFLLCTMASIGLLRSCCLPIGPPPRPRALSRAELLDAWGPPGTEPYQFRPRPPPPRFPSQPVRGPALLWKEMDHACPLPDDTAFRTRLLLHWRALAAPLILLAVVFVTSHWLNPSPWRALDTGFNVVLRVLTVALMSGWCILLGFRISGSISRERDRGTLDGLLTLPVEREDIFRAKWLGSILRYRLLGYGLLATWAIGLALGMLHPWAVLLLVAACGAHLAFMASFGLWLSLVGRTTLGSNLCMALVLLLLVSWAGAGVGSDLPLSGVQEGTWGGSFLEVGLNPGRAWWFAAFSWQDLAGAIVQGDQAFLHALPMAPLGIVFFAVAAWLLWRYCCRQLQREHQRGQ